jgi:hypothetical protein
VFRHRYPTEACVVRKTVPPGTLAGCEALGTKVSLILWDGNKIERGRTASCTVRTGQCRTVQYGVATASTKAVGGQDRAVWLIYMNR